MRRRTYQVSTSKETGESTVNNLINHVWLNLNDNTYKVRSEKL